MKNERLGLLMILASLVVIALIIGLLFQHETKATSVGSRVQGTSLVQALSSVPMEDLAPKIGQPGLLSTLLNVQENPNLAYAVIVDPQGSKLAGVISPGASLPPASLSAEPASWFGERSLTLPENGAAIREFHGPVLRGGDLAGYVRVGYRTDAAPLGMDQLSFLASLALPIFLLTPLSYFLLKREIRPLAEINRKIEHWAAASEKPIAIAATGDLRDFMERFNRFVQVAEARVRDLEGEHVNMLTSNHLLGYEKEKMEAMLEALPDAVIVLDEARVVTFASVKVAPLLGVRHDAILGKPPRDWCGNGCLLAFLERYQNHLAHRMDPIECDQPPDKKIMVAAYPLMSPRDSASVFGTLIVLRDTTSEYLMKRAGAEFVAHVSHELKTPLNTLSMYSETLLDDAEHARALNTEAINLIHDEAERMAALINNLLNISKIEMGSVSLDRRRIKLPDLLRDTFDNAVKNSAGQSLEFDLQLPRRLSPVSLDKDLFRIALNNLLTNAIKYSRPGGTVTLAAEESDSQILVRVRDNGIGVAADERERIFDKFYRSADPAANGRGGHGLGLFLCKEIIRLHHGTLAVESEPGRGAEFSIVLEKTPALVQEAI